MGTAAEEAIWSIMAAVLTTAIVHSALIHTIGAEGWKKVKVSIVTKCA